MSGRRIITPQVTTFGHRPGHSRLSAFHTADGYRVTVEGPGESESDAARALATELAGACATESAWADVERSCDRAARIEWVCAELVAGRVVLGKRLSVGPHTPAVASAHAWAVIGRGGAPIVLAHDSFEAARAFVDCEERGPSEFEDECYAMDTDAERENSAFEDRVEEWRWRLAGYERALEAERTRTHAKGAA